MILHFLNFNKSKIESLIFRRSGACDMDLPSLEIYANPIAKNLGVTLESGVKLDKQINLVMKSSFFPLRLLSEVSPFYHLMILKGLYMLSSHPNLTNALYVGVSQPSHFQLLQNFGACLLTVTQKWEQISLVMVPCKFWD